MSASADLDCPGGPPPLGERPMVLVAAVALVDADGRVLIAQRPPGKSMAGLWEFPGGKVDVGETPEQALVRELREELGIETATSCLAPIAFASHGYEKFHLLMPVFACRKWLGTPQPREGQFRLHPSLAAHQFVPFIHHHAAQRGEGRLRFRVGQKE